MLRCAVIPLSFLAALTLAASADDEVVFDDDSGLRGAIESLEEDGRLLLSSSLAHEPLELRAERVRRVIFSAASQPPADSHDSLVVLANGDLFGCDLSGIDADAIRARTRFAGELTIPREAIHTVQLGVRPRKLLYRGPEDLAGWEMKGGWRMEQDRFIAESSGTIVRGFDIPGSFSLRFRVRWRSSPNLDIHFADEGITPTAAASGKANRYVLRFNPGGFELKREQEDASRRDPPMVHIPREPSSFSDSAVDIDLRVDRKLNQVHLYLNGEYEGRFPDPFKRSPAGGGLLFRSGHGGDDNLIIDGIELREWDASADRHRSEERGDSSQDAIILRDGQRGPARIVGLHPGEDGGSIEFKSPHLPKNDRLPAADISTLFFARHGKAPSGKTPLRLVLHGRGSLGLTACTFTGDLLHARHPLLGDLTIRRDAIARLERPRPESDEEEQEEEQ